MPMLRPLFELPAPTTIATFPFSLSVTSFHPFVSGAAGETAGGDFGYHQNFGFAA
jgi:hypothetical protein